MFKCETIAEKSFPDFEAFKIVEVLEYYDFPRLLLMESPEKQMWLFSWADSNESDLDGIEEEDEEAIYHQWIAFRISNNRLFEIRNSDISLKELIYLAEIFPPKRKYPDFYIFKSYGMFNIIDVSRTLPEFIPSNVLPRRDIPINRNLQRVEKPIEENRVNLDIHFIPNRDRQGYIPLRQQGPFEEYFQNFITRCSYKIRRPNTKNVFPSDISWTEIDAGIATTGSYRLFCESRTTNQKQINIVSQCVEFLQYLCQDDYYLISDRYGQLLSDLIKINIETLFKHIIQNNMEVHIKWYSLDNKWNSIFINKRIALKVLESIKKVSTSKEEECCSIKIILTQQEADDIKKPVDRKKGGWQKILDNLQKKLNDDNSIFLTPNEIEKIIDYSLGHGSGGFQSRLLGIVNAIKRMRKSTTGLI